MGAGVKADDIIRAQNALAETRAKAERESWRRERKALVAHAGELEKQLRVLLDLEAARKELPPTAVPRRGRVLSSDRREAAAFAVASDWHVEERVDPKVIQGLNEYNPQIAELRAARFFEGIEWLILEQRRTFTIRELYLFAIGDFITGYIHEELREGNFLSPIQAVLFWQDLFERGIRQLLARVPDLAIKIAFRIGNHGRTTHKTQIATAAANSFEFGAYAQLRRLFANEPRVQIQLDEGHHSIVEVYDYRVHLHHGDSVRYAGGIGGIDVPLNRAAVQWRNKYKCHLSIVGHFHDGQMGETIIRNDSLIGYGAYSDWLPSAQPHSAWQAFGIIDRKRGKCKNITLWVDEKPRRG